MSQQPQQQQQPQPPPPQQQQQQHPYSNHGGRGGGGRGGGGGVGHGGQQQQQHFPQYGGGRGGPPQMGAWQPAYNPQGGGRPVPGYAPAMHAPHPHMGYHHPAAYTPNHFYPAAAAGAGPRGPWQQQQPPQQQQQPQPGNSYRGGVFYPAAATPGAGAPPTTPAAPLPVRERKPLVITDKDGNPIDLSKPSKAKATATTPAPAPAAAAAAAVTPSADAGEKMKQAALERLSAKDTTPKESAKQQPELKETPPAKKETVKKAEAAPAKVETAAPPPPPPPQTNGVGKAAEKPKPSSLAAAVASSPKRTPPTPPTADGKHVYTKGKLLSFKDLPSCTERPSDLPALQIVKREEQQSDRGGGGRRESRRSSSQRNHHDGGDQWARGSAPPRNSNKGGGGGGDHRGGGGGGGSDWARGQAQPRQQPQKAGSRRSGRGQPPPLYDGPVAPLVKTENHWKPVKNTSALVVAEKKVKAILNKMTKEKFERLSTQMLEIPIISYETLTMMIDNVYDKAIDEPAFGDMYGDLCVRLSQMVQGNQFVHIIESDEEPPTEDGQAPAPSSDDTGNMHTVYRWSNDVSTTDAEVVGPLKSAEECFDAAFSAEEMSPIERGEMELELVSVSIRRGRFLKVMKRKGSEEEEYYVVYFPTVEAQDCGQQLSTIFLSEVECQSDASRKNSFKRSLLNKCESEFNKQDIYVDWKKDKQEYEAAKSTFTDAERSEKEGDLNFRRIKIKKQMLGNVKFIGQLYKKGLIKEKIMRYCIGSTLKLDEDTTVKSKNPEYTDSGNVDMDEEDHEAICSMFGTIGSTIDHPQSAGFMDVCFTKINGLSQSKSLPSRSRFMYKDLIELRGNRWVPRRKEEKAKTIAEIRKDVEREERRQSQQSAQQNRGGRGGGGDYRSGGRGGNDYRSRPAPGPARPRQPKPTTVTDDDGFTTIVSGRSAFQPKSIQTKPKQDTSSGPSISPPAAASPSSKAVASVDQDTLEKIIKRIRSDFVNEGGNEEEVLLSWEEISGTKDAGMELVTKNADRMLDCKEPERIAICKIIVLLCEKGKVTPSDVQEGLKDVIEFIDSVVLDCPRAFEYLGDLLGQLLRIKMINMPWLCEQLSKTKCDPSTKAPFEVLKHTLLGVKSASGAGASTAFAKESTVGQLLGEEKLKSLVESLS